MSKLYVRPTTPLQWSDIINIDELKSHPIKSIGGDVTHNCQRVLDCEKQPIVSQQASTQKSTGKNQSSEQAFSDSLKNVCHTACYSRDESFCLTTLAAFYGSVDNANSSPDFKVKADLIKQKLSLVQMGAYRPYAALETDQLIVILAAYLKELDELSKPSKARPRANIDNLIAMADKQKKNYDAALQYYDSLTNASASTTAEQANAKKSYSATHDAIVKKATALADFVTLLDNMATDYGNDQALKRLFSDPANQAKIEKLIDSIALDYRVVNAITQSTERINQLNAMSDLNTQYKTTKTADDRFALLALYRTASTPLSTTDLSTEFVRLKKAHATLLKLFSGDWTEEQRQQFRDEALNQFKSVVLSLINVVSTFR